MSSQYGNNIRISIFGQAHSPAVGVSMEGLPAGIALDMGELHSFLRRRAPGQSDISSARVENDQPEVLAGLVNGRTCGAPLAIIIRNLDACPADYCGTRDVPRPSHADYTAHVKYGGYQDTAGGGHFSGRLTAPLCAAGGICLQILRSLGIDIGAHILRLGGLEDEAFCPLGVTAADFAAILDNPLPVLRREAGEAMRARILGAREKGDSLGGVVECAAIGLPPGLGGPLFGGLESRIAAIIFGIPGAKGIEFGSGFAGAGRSGMQNNDSFYMEGGQVKTRTNHSGGILGGISTGMPLLFRVAFKPTPSVGLEQGSVSLSRGEDTVLRITGRHDTCIAPRATPCVEAAAAIAIYDAYLGFI